MRVEQKGGIIKKLDEYEDSITLFEELKEKGITLLIFNQMGCNVPRPEEVYYGTDFLPPTGKQPLDRLPEGWNVSFVPPTPLTSESKRSLNILIVKEKKTVSPSLVTKVSVLVVYAYYANGKRRELMIEGEKVIFRRDVPVDFASGEYPQDYGLDWEIERALKIAAAHPKIELLIPASKDLYLQG